MGTTSTSQSAGLTALAAQPTALVAKAIRMGAPAVAGVPLTPGLVEEVRSVVQAATGTPQWRLEHFRDPRPLAEMLEVSRLIFDQRCVLVAA